MSYVSCPQLQQQQKFLKIQVSFFVVVVVVPPFCLYILLSPPCFWTRQREVNSVNLTARDLLKRLKQKKTNKKKWNVQQESWRETRLYFSVFLSLLRVCEMRLQTSAMWFSFFSFSSCNATATVVFDGFAVSPIKTDTKLWYNNNELYFSSSKEKRKLKQKSNYCRDILKSSVKWTFLFKKETGLRNNKK